MALLVTLVLLAPFVLLVVLLGILLDVLFPYTLLYAMTPLSDVNVPTVVLIGLSSVGHFLRLCLLLMSISGYFTIAVI